MGAWRFLLDENVDPKTAVYLEKEGVYVEHVRDALGQGADDEADVLPYARTEDLIVVTSDLKDFGGLDPESHVGVVIRYDDTMSAYGVAAGLLAIVDAYPSRDAFAGREELDPWV